MGTLPKSWLGQWWQIKLGTSEAANLLLSPPLVSTQSVELPLIWWKLLWVWLTLWAKLSDGVVKGIGSHAFTRTCCGMDADKLHHFTSTTSFIFTQTMHAFLIAPEPFHWLFIIIVTLLMHACSIATELSNWIQFFYHNEDMHWI